MITLPSAVAPEQVICSVVIPGDPTTKARPRVVGRRAYTPTRTKRAEAAIGWQIKSDCPGLEPNATHDLGVLLRFFTKTRQRRDLDNLIKLVLDACTGIVWGDDLQVIELNGQVQRGDNDPRIELVVYTIGESRIRLCRTCGVPIERKPGRALNQKYCSKECYDKAQRRGQYVHCVVCQKRIYRQVEKLALYSNHYCSPGCKALAKNDERKCRHCGTIFRAYKSARQSFCCEECRRAFHDARKDMPWRESA